MEKRQGSLSISNIAFTYVGTVVGAGFASGQEILLFFTKYGPISYALILMTSGIFMYMGSKILTLGRGLRAQSYGDIIEDIFGRLAPFINIYLFLAYMVISIAMFAGAGALFKEYRNLGVLVTAVLAAITIFKGIGGIVHVNFVIIPLLIIFNIVMFVYNIPLSNGANVYIEPDLPTFFRALKSGIMYTSYNIILCIGVLVPLGSSMNSKSTARWGGYMGGILIGMMLLMSNFSLSGYIKGVSTVEIPLLHMANGISPIYGRLYTFILWGAIFTTLIANLFSIVSIIESRLPSRLHNITMLLAIAVFVLLSRFGFSNIIAIMYPILGVLGCIFLVYLLVNSYG